MKAVMVTGPGQVEFVNVPEPAPSPADVLVRPRACGICGSDAAYVRAGGVPPRLGETILGHEASAEVVSVGDRVVVNPLGDRSGIIGNGGPVGALSELLMVRGAVLGASLREIPADLPYDVAALNEPVAVARHAVHRSGAKPGDKAVVLGARPIGLGAVLGFKAVGVEHVVAVDIVPDRLERALDIGADAVINSAEDDVKAHLLQLHGTGADAYTVARGKVLGGSSSLNGAYFVRPRRTDLARWASENPAWAPERVLPYMKRLENDLRYGETEQHGGHGPMPVYRELDNPSELTRAFHAAAELGFP